jgi:pimeloyl-ACP methyl ester carboxylesterase
MLSVFGVVVLAYAGILGLLWRFQERIVFQPPAKPEAQDTASSTLTYAADDGVRLMAPVIEPITRGGPVILVFHGNAMISRWMIPWAREVSRRFDATVVLPEYRGYDGLAGVPTYRNGALDAAAALAATQQRFHVSPGEMIFYGHSLGSAIATELAAHTPPRALMLESPLTSAQEMAARMPIVGLRFFWSAIARVHYDTRQRVAKLDVPVNVAHGERDLVIPVRMGRAVFEAARRKGGLLIVAEGDHNDVPVSGGDAYWRWFEEAIRGNAH